MRGPRAPRARAPRRKASDNRLSSHAFPALFVAQGAPPKSRVDRRSQARRPGFSIDGADRIAAQMVARLAARAARGGEGRQLGSHGDARRHVEGGEPAVEPGAKRRGKAGLIAEVDDVQRAAGRQRVDRSGQSLAPRRDHRQGVGNHHPLEIRAAEQRRRVEGRQRRPGPRARATPIRRGRSRRARSPASRWRRRARKAELAGSGAPS